LPESVRYYIRFLEASIQRLEKQVQDQAQKFKNNLSLAKEVNPIKSQVVKKVEQEKPILLAICMKTSLAVSLRLQGISETIIKNRIRRGLADAEQ
jgi:hypothetical protein